MQIVWRYLTPLLEDINKEVSNINEKVTVVKINLDKEHMEKSIEKAQQRKIEAVQHWQLLTARGDYSKGE